MSDPPGTQFDGPDAAPLVVKTSFGLTPVVNTLAEIMSSILCYIWFSPSKGDRDEEPTPPSVLMRQFRPSQDFQRFVHVILTTTQVSTSVVLLALYFIYRLKNENSITGARGSEYRLAITALMLANKMLDDHTYTAKTWSEVSGIALEPIKAGELEFLKGLDFNLHITLDAYNGWERFIHGIAQAKNAPAGKRRRRTNIRSTEHHHHNEPVVLPSIRTLEAPAEARVYAPLPNMSRAGSQSPTAFVRQQSISHVRPIVPASASTHYADASRHPPPTAPAALAEPFQQSQQQPAQHPAQAERHYLYPAPHIPNGAAVGWPSSTKRGSVDVFAADGQPQPKRFASSSSSISAVQQTPEHTIDHAYPPANSSADLFQYRIAPEQFTISPGNARPSSRYASIPGSNLRHGYSLRSGSGTPTGGAPGSSLLTPPPSSSIALAAVADRNGAGHPRYTNLASFSHLCDPYSPANVRHPAQIGASNLMFYSLAAGQARGIANYHNPGPVPIVTTPRYPTATVTPLRAKMVGSLYWDQSLQGPNPERAFGQGPARSQVAPAANPFFYQAPAQQHVYTAPYESPAYTQSRPSTSSGITIPTRTPAQRHVLPIPHSVHGGHGSPAPTSPWDYAFFRRSSQPNPQFRRQPSASKLSQQQQQHQHQQQYPLQLQLQSQNHFDINSANGRVQHVAQVVHPSRLHQSYTAVGVEGQSYDAIGEQPPAHHGTLVPHTSSLVYSNYSNAGVPGVYGIETSVRTSTSTAQHMPATFTSIHPAVSFASTAPTSKPQESGWRPAWSWDQEQSTLYPQAAVPPQSDGWREAPNDGWNGNGSAGDAIAHTARTTLTPTFAHLHPGK